MSMVNVSDNPRMALYSVLSCICILTLHMIVHLIVHVTGGASGSQDITAEDCIKIGKGQLSMSSLTLVHMSAHVVPLKLLIGNLAVSDMMCRGSSP